MDSCSCCSGVWKPGWGRDRILPGDTGRSWFFTNPVHFSAIRFALAFVGSIFLIFSMATDKPPPPPQDPAHFAQGWFSYWKFYSHWTLALCTLYCAMASMFSYALWKHEKNPMRRELGQQHFNWAPDVQVAHPHQARRSDLDLSSDLQSVALEEAAVAEAPEPVHRRQHHRRISFSELCLWFLYQTVWAAAIFCACTFWLFIGIGCLPRKGCTDVNSKFWMAQTLNLLFLVTELSLNKLPFIPFHSILTLAYCVLWLIFSAILYFVTGQWVYPKSATHGQLYAAITFWPGWIALNVACFFIGFSVEWFLSKFFPTKHSIANAHLPAPRRHSAHSRSLSSQSIP
jgi:hypothetical protein